MAGLARWSLGLAPSNACLRDSCHQAEQGGNGAGGCRQLFPGLQERGWFDPASQHALQLLVGLLDMKAYAMIRHPLPVHPFGTFKSCCKKSIIRQLSHDC
eukprot:366232-Chlamydomonas_euryale.AAC.13